MEVWNNFFFEGVFYWSRDNIAKKLSNMVMEKDRTPEAIFLCGLTFPPK